MEQTESYSLVSFVNRSSTRFMAKVHHFGTQCWVLVADKEPKQGDGYPAALEPVTDFEQHLTRARCGDKCFPAEYVSLLERWNSLHHPA